MQDSDYQYTMITEMEGDANMRGFGDAKARLI